MRKLRPEKSVKNAKIVFNGFVLLSTLDQLEAMPLEICNGGGNKKITKLRFKLDEMFLSSVELLLLRKSSISSMLRRFLKSIPFVSCTEITAKNSKRVSEFV